MTEYSPFPGTLRSNVREVTEVVDAFNGMLDGIGGLLDERIRGEERLRQFIADASHELRTPLTVIKGQLEVLAAQEHPSREEVRRVEELVSAEVSRISRLVDDLLVLARSEQTEFLRLEHVPLESFVSELWDGFAVLEAERRFELGAVPAGSLRADPDRYFCHLAHPLRPLGPSNIAILGPFRLRSGSPPSQRGQRRSPPRPAATHRDQWHQCSRPGTW